MTYLFSRPLETRLKLMERSNLDIWGVIDIWGVVKTMSVNETISGDHTKRRSVHCSLTCGDHHREEAHKGPQGKEKTMGCEWKY